MREVCHEASPFCFPSCLCVLASDAIARAASGMWPGRSQGVCVNPQGLGRSCRAEECCPALLPCKSARGVLLLEEGSSA